MAGTQISNLFLKIHGIETRIHNGEKIVSLITDTEIIGYSHAKKKKSDLYLIPVTKINLKWIKNVNARPTMVKLLGKKIGKILILVSVMIILFETPKAQATQVEVNKWVYIKLNTFYTEMETEN